MTGTISADPDTIGAANPFLAVRTTYDTAGRPIKQETGYLASWQSEAVAPSGWTGFTIERTAETQYDAMGRKLREWVREDAAGAVRTMTEYSYDAVGRLTCTAVRMNPAVFAFTGIPNACAPNATGADGRDRITRNIYDAAGQRLQHRVGVGFPDEEGAEATWTYNANGQVTAVIDGNGNRAELRYDGHGRQDRWTFPSTARPPSYDTSTIALSVSSAGSANASDYEEYGYDPNGNRLSLRKRDNAQHYYGVIAYEYDALNRLTRKTVPERLAPHPYPLDAIHTRDVFYAYDLRGLQTHARFDSQSGPGIVNSYDGFGRLSWTDQHDPGGTVRRLAHGYDANGNRTRITHPDLAPGQPGPWFGMLYDKLNRPVRIAENADGTGASGTYLATNYYNPDGSRESTLRGMTGPTSDYAYTTYNYDGIGRLAGITDQFSDGAAYNVWHSFAYNPASGIGGITRDTDAYAWQGHYAVSRAYDTNGLNQYGETTSAGGNATFTYDGNGNLRTTPAPNGQTTTYTYDVENRLVAASTGAILRYDPLGRLWQTSAPGFETMRYLYDGDALVAEYDAGGNQLARFVHGSGADVPMVWYGGATVSQANRRYLIPNHQGSIVGVADGYGAVIAINRYDEYGIPASTNQGRFQYTGQIWLGELGMYHYKARIYSPTLGRFLQTDPIGYEDQVNLYAYVGNDPVNGSDPTGERVVVSAHPVFFQAGPVTIHTGYYHLKMTIIPNNQSTYANDTRFTTNNTGTVFTTLGAGPENPSLSRPQGDLVSRNLRENDVSAAGIYVADIVPGAGDTEDALIGRIFEADSNYRDNLPYDFFPEVGGETFNSNSYIEGLLNAIGVQNLPNLVPTPGRDNPVPRDCFINNSKGCR